MDDLVPMCRSEDGGFNREKLEIKNPAKSGIYWVLEAGLEPAHPRGHYPLKMGKNQETTAR